MCVRVQGWAEGKPSQQQFVRSMVSYHILRVAQQLVATSQPSDLLERQLPIR